MNHERYLSEVEALVVSLHDILSEKEVGEVQHLIDHGEPAEGLLTLAWIIHNGQKSVSRETVQLMMLLMDDLVSNEHLPPNFSS